MSETIKEVESVPSQFPELPGGLSAAAAALGPDAIWKRIEDFVAHRWAPRSVIWTVEGPGEWEPPLTPATISAVEVWVDNAWTAVTLDPSALGGYVLPGCGPYRFTASVGASPSPWAAREAYRRLAEYLADTSKAPSGSTAYSVNAGAVSISHDRSAAWLARAMQNSGAADLLRAYRRA